ncbi:MAG: ABC transporter substrate-binding protein [Ruthenibacterium lactatiformans]
MKKANVSFGSCCRCYGAFGLGGGRSVGSASGSAPAAGSTPAEAEGKITISYWTTNRHDQAYMTPLIESSMRPTTKISTLISVYADNYSQMLDLAFSTNTAPDVYQLAGTDPIEVVVKEKGQLLDLAPYMDDEYRARFGEGAFVEGINALGDGIYSLPYTASAARLFYNQDIFDRVGIDGPPQTLDELVADAKLVTEQLGSEGIYGIAGNFKSAASSVARSIDMIVMRSGGTRGGFDYKTGTYDFSSYKPVLEAFKEMFATGVSFRRESLDIDPLRTQFAAGNIAMYISISHAEPGVYASQFPTDANWNCAQLPTVNGKVEGKQQLWFGGSNLGINPATEHPDEAWEVMKFLHSDEVMGPYHTAGLGTVMIPSAVESAEAPESIEKMPNLAINADDQNWPPLPAGVVVEGKDYYTTCVECIFGVTDIDSAIEDLNTRYNAAYDKLVDGGAERIVYPNFDPLKQDTAK